MSQIFKNGIVPLIVSSLLFGFAHMSNPEVKEYTDMTKLEVMYMAPLCVAVILFGIWPSPILNMMKASVGQLVSLLATF